MKLMIASDIHGSLGSCEQVRGLYFKEKAERLILLGDLLYHGPRNDLPVDYAPKGVIKVLNGIKDELLCVRGNCDAEVDQMVLEFPILSDSLVLWLDGHMVFATHGHLYNELNLPLLKQGDILLHGHTHIAALEKREHYILINPGSVSLPKENTPKSYLVYEDGTFLLKEMDGTTVKTLSITK